LPYSICILPCLSLMPRETAMMHFHWPCRCCRCVQGFFQVEGDLRQVNQIRAEAFVGADGQTAAVEPAPFLP
jgi:hypothetical protein